MKNRLLIIMLFVLFFSVDLYALTVSVDFGNTTLNTVLAPKVATEISNQIAKYDNMPELAKGFGNANTYASHAATLRGYQGYDLFAISGGAMLSVQAPDKNPKFYNDLKDKLDNGDVYAGLGGNPAVGQLGINLGFITDGLYISFKFGKFSYGIDQSDIKIDYKSRLYGVLVNYQFFGEEAIFKRIFLWRGLSVESGYIYSNNVVSFYKDIDAVTVSNGGYTATVDPSIDLVLDTRSGVVPIEVYTSIRFLYVANIGVGGGIDFVPHGSTSFKLKSAGTISVTGDSVTPAPATLVGTKGSVTIDAGTRDKEPDFCRPKLMINMGLSAGPVFIDIPLAYYFTDNGYAVGVSAGFAW